MAKNLCLRLLSILLKFSYIHFFILFYSKYQAIRVRLVSAFLVKLDRAISAVICLPAAREKLWTRMKNPAVIKLRKRMFEGGIIKRRS